VTVSVFICEFVSETMIIIDSLVVNSCLYFCRYTI